MHISFFRVFHHLIIKHQRMPEDVKKDKRSSKSTKKSHMTTSGLHKQRLLIPVRKYDSEVFRMMIQFVHTGSAYITDENVSGN